MDDYASIQLLERTITRLVNERSRLGDFAALQKLHFGLVDLWIRS